MTNYKFGTWYPIDSAPKHGKPILIFYKNSLGKNRTVKACYLDKFQEESCDSFEPADYDEETDQYYYPEGWWELIDNWEDYSMVVIHEGNPTHWTPLPPPPEEK